MTCIPIPRGYLCVAPRVVEIERWLVEVHPHCGPILVGKRGDPLKNQPGPRSRFWDAFERWERRSERKRHGLLTARDVVKASAHPSKCRQNATLENL